MQPLQDTMLMSDSKFLLHLASLPTGAVSDDNDRVLPSMADLVCECLQHPSTAVQLQALDYVAEREMDLKIEESVVDVLVHLAESATGEEVLADVYAVLERLVPRRPFCQQLWQSLATRALQLMSRAFLRYLYTCIYMYAHRTCTCMHGVCVCVCCLYC